MVFNPLVNYSMIILPCVVHCHIFC